MPWYITCPARKTYFPKHQHGRYTATNKVEICGVDTSKLPVIPEGQLVSYFRRINSGDVAAREEFIRGNLRLVLSIVQRFAMRGENMDDLFQVGCIGLIKAVDNFNVDYGLKFSTYAVPMILGELRRYLRDGTPIRVSRSLRDIAYRAFAVRTRLAEQNSTEPAAADIAKELGLAESEVAYAISAVQEPVSLFEPIYQDGGDALYMMDSLADEKNTDERWLTSIALKEAIGKLGERERKIVSLRFFEGRTQTEVSREVGISQAQVSRLEKSAIKSIRKNFGV